MSVAKSFQNFEFLTEPYLVGQKEYIKVRNPKTGTVREVRWYAEAKTPTAAPAVVIQKPNSKPQKDVLGFTNGYITIFKGNVENNEDYFRASNARYAVWWGWYIISTEEVPADLPEDIQPIQLPWELVGNTDGTLKIEKLVRQAVDSVLFEPSLSQYVGQIGERIEEEITVIKNVKIENKFAITTIHIMENEDGNIFVWKTSSKNWPEGSRKKIRGTVKEHELYKGVRQTHLTRCVER